MKKNMIVYVSFFGLLYYVHIFAMNESMVGHNNIESLFKAIRSNDVPLVTTMIQESPDLVRTYADKISIKNHLRTVFSEAVSALHLAAHDGRTKCMKILLKNNADPNCLTKERHSPLHYVRNVKGAKLLFALWCESRSKNRCRLYTFYEVCG